MKKILRFLQNELFRLFSSKVFLTTLSALLCLTVIDGILAWSVYRQNLNQTLSEIPLNSEGNFVEYPWLQIYTLYNSWIGGRVNQLIPQIFLYTMPIFSVLPFAASYLKEKRSGYTKTMTAKLGKRCYFFGKYLSAFLSGFFIIFIPMVFSLIFTACLIPAYKPDVGFTLYYQVGDTNLLNEIYFSKPLLASIIAIFRVSFFAGTWCTIPFALSFFVENKFIVLISPYLVLLFLISSFEKALVYRSYLETSIFDYIWLTSPTMTQSFWIYLAESLALFLPPLLITLTKGDRTDVF